MSLKERNIQMSHLTVSAQFELALNAPKHGLVVGTLLAFSNLVLMTVPMKNVIQQVVFAHVSFLSFMSTQRTLDGTRCIVDILVQTFLTEVVEASKCHRIHQYTDTNRAAEYVFQLLFLLILLFS